jgi:hypothetical protein
MKVQTCLFKINRGDRNHAFTRTNATGPLKCRDVWLRNRTIVILHCSHKPCAGRWYRFNLSVQVNNSEYVLRKVKNNYWIADCNSPTVNKKKSMQTNGTKLNSMQQKRIYDEVLKEMKYFVFVLKASAQNLYEKAIHKIVWWLNFTLLLTTYLIELSKTQFIKIFWRPLHDLCLRIAN